MGTSVAPLGRAWRWCRSKWRLFLVLSIISAAPAVASALAMSDPVRKKLEVIGALVALYAQLFLTARVLDAVGAMPAGYERHQATEGRILAALVAAVIYVVGVLLGLVLLILPGVMLYVLWGLWMPLMLAERRRPSAVLRRSWHLVRPHVGWTSRFTIATLLVFGAALIPALPLRAVIADPRIGNAAIELLLAPASLLVAVAYAFAFVTLRDAAGTAAMGAGAKT